MSGKSYRAYYKELYAIQDGVFKIVEDYDFYLTGGTALSRFYLQHRYSDDLDFFVHQKAGFLAAVKEIITQLKAQYNLETRIMTTDFAQVDIHSGEFHKKFREQFQAKLKIDFVNELQIPRFGELSGFEVFSRVDNLRNMLSNKLTAITRLEPKDIADIWYICKNFSFKWDEIIREAEQKEVIEELMVFDLLKTFPLHMFRPIRWIDPIEVEDFEKDRKIILQDILTRAANSLSGKK
ncbi:MAG: nucleotidyl transferase AbiEii/AbiGii toxin family protein [Candidatus Aminicenantes bacterium]|nr:nucleotidyl transferase AbiEii/AbiGii toxin family protein [Candidatus Aminicenantes bacterium]